MILKSYLEMFSNDRIATLIQLIIRHELLYLRIKLETMLVSMIKPAICAHSHSINDHLLNSLEEG